MWDYFVNILNIYMWLYRQCVLKTCFDYFANIFFYNNCLCPQRVLKTGLDYFLREASCVAPDSTKHLFDYVFDNNQIAYTYSIANDVSG